MARRTALVRIGGYLKDLPAGDTLEGSLPASTQIITTLSDFPAPVSNVITLADNTTYVISGTVDISPNRIVVGVKNTISGTDRQNDILMSNTAGIMFTMDNSVTPKTTLIFDTLTLKATAGTLISATGGTTDQVTFITTTITQTPNGGTLSGVAFSMRTSSLSAFTTNGFVFSGSNQALTFRDSSATNNVGTVFNCTSATFSVVRVSRNSITASSGNTFLNATGTTITTAANLALNIFSGTSTHLVGVNETTPSWVFTANQGIANTPVGGSASITAASINTGTTPKFRHRITVTDATVSATSKIILDWGQMTDLDENDPEMDAVSFRTIAGTGQFDVVIASPKMIRGVFKTNYTVG